MHRAYDIAMFALPADPGGGGERLFHHGRSIDKDLEIAAALANHPACERFQRLFDDIMIVGPLRINRNAALRPRIGERQRIDRRRVTHAKRDDAVRLGPKRCGCAALTLARLHPVHIAVITFSKPGLKALRLKRGNLSQCDSAADKTKFAGLIF